MRASPPPLNLNKREHYYVKEHNTAPSFKSTGSIFSVNGFVFFNPGVQRVKEKLGNDTSKTTSMLSPCALLKPLFSPQTAFQMES